MIKSKVLVFLAILMLALAGCERVEQEQLTVYSFSGENEQLSISNGIIVLNGTKEIFTGGDLKVTDDFFNKNPDLHTGPEIEIIIPFPK